MRYSENCQKWLLLTVITLFCALASEVWAAKWTDGPRREKAQNRFAQLERTFNGRLGVFALDTGSGSQLGYRANEQFHFASTFKAFLATMILKKSARDPNLLQQRIRYSRSALVAHSPVTEKHTGEGMTISELLDALLKYSDNTAANLLLWKVGGPTAVTAFMKSLGNSHFRLESWEPNLKNAPGDPQDTSTPKAMGKSLRPVVLGDILPAAQREQLRQGLMHNAVADTCIRAGVPHDWKVGDRSGGGAYGTRNDIAILWPPHHAPIVLSIFTYQFTKNAMPQDQVIAEATKIVVDWVTKRQ